MFQFVLPIFGEDNGIRITTTAKLYDMKNQSFWEGQEVYCIEPKLEFSITSEHSSKIFKGGEEVLNGLLNNCSKIKDMVDYKTRSAMQGVILKETNEKNIMTILSTEQQTYNKKHNDTSYTVRNGLIRVIEMDPGKQCQHYPTDSGSM